VPKVSNDIEADLTRFILQELMVDEQVLQLERNQPLLTGLLDSFALMSLVTFVEDRYGVDVEVRDVTAENFGTVRDLADFVRAGRTRSVAREAARPVSDSAG
jgi:acyl carrier protein